MEANVHTLIDDLPLELAFVIKSVPEKALYALMHEAASTAYQKNFRDSQNFRKTG